PVTRGPLSICFLRAVAAMKSGTASAASAKNARLTIMASTSPKKANWDATTTHTARRHFEDRHASYACCVKGSESGIDSGYRDMRVRATAGSERSSYARETRWKTTPSSAPVMMQMGGRALNLLKVTFGMAIPPARAV